MEQIDSTEAEHAHFVKCAAIHFAQMRKSIAGHVHFTGTDTLQHKAARMHLMLPNPPVPIIISGSQLGFDERWTDAPRNLRDAIYVASHPDTPLGVLVVFNGHIFDPKFVAKRSSSSLDAFASVNGEYIGEVEAPNHLRIFRNADRSATDDDPQFLPEFDLGVKVQEVTPETTEEDLATVLERANVHGLVLRGYGLGNIPTRLLPVLRTWARVKPIAVGTQCFSGPVNGKYEVGRLARETGVLAAGNFSPAYTLALLGWLLPRVSDMDHLKEIWNNIVQSSLRPGSPPILTTAEMAQAA